MGIETKIKPPDLPCAIDLTAIMKREGIQRFYYDRKNEAFAVALYGGRYGTGATVGEAWRNALADERVAV